MADIAVLRWRNRLRRTTGGRLIVKSVVFALGAAFVTVGLVLVVLPGPLTIPPVLLGLYLWSTEFDWALRWKDRALTAGQTAWAAARKHPVHTGAVTTSGLAVAAAAVYAASRYHLVDRVTDALG